MLRFVFLGVSQSQKTLQDYARINEPMLCVVLLLPGYSQLQTFLTAPSTFEISRVVSDVDAGGEIRYLTVQWNAEVVKTVCCVSFTPIVAGNKLQLQLCNQYK